MFCFGRCRTNINMDVSIKELSEHSHVLNPNRLHVIRLENEIKIRGLSSDEAVSTVLFDALRKMPLHACANLPSNEALLQTIRRERPQIQLDYHGRLPLILRETERVENFIFYEDDSMTIDINLNISTRMF